MANKKYEEEAEANREAARERRLARVSSKDEKRRMLIGANQEMLKKSRQEEKTRMRGDRAVPKLEKVPELELDNLEVTKRGERGSRWNLKESWLANGRIQAIA